MSQKLKVRRKKTGDRRQETGDGINFSSSAPSLPLLVCILWLYSSVPGLAQNRQPEPEQQFYNPLEITTPDPLLPQLTRPLSTPEKLKLRAALDELNQQAAARFVAGDTEKAFAIWSRELRLRRSLGIGEEIPALGRVGEIAWQENRRLELNAITRRLQEIGQQIQVLPPDKTKKQEKQDREQSQVFTPPSLDILNALGIAFQQVREPRSAIAVYERILAIQRQQRDAVAAQTTLRTIAELHLSWFNYAPAATAYEQLLQNATERGDRLEVINYLQQLNYIYEQARQYQQALAVKQRLGEIYQQQQQNDLLPALQLDIGRNYAALGQLKQAFTTYQQAYTAAWELQQYAQASNALRQMVQLYRSQQQTEAALQTSQILLESDRLASNFYGMMNTYDQIGQINLNRGNYDRALAAFQQALKLAQQLKYQEDYFTQQIQQIDRRRTQ